MNDRERISGIKAGSLSDFKALVDNYQSRVINICYGFLKNKEDAEDIAQEVFIEVYQSISTFREESKLSTWIYRISVRKALDFIRKKNRKKRLLPLQKTGHSQNGPEKRLIDLERTQILKQAVEALIFRAKNNLQKKLRRYFEKIL